MIREEGDTILQNFTMIREEVVPDISELKKQDRKDIDYQCNNFIITEESIPGMDQLFAKVGSEEFSSEVNSIIEKIQQSKYLMSEEHLETLLELIDQRNECEFLLELRILYKYYKYYPKDASLQIVDNELEIINSLLPFQIAAKLLAILIRKDHEVIMKLVQINRDILSFTRNLGRMIDMPEFTNGAYHIIEAMFETNYYDAKLYNLFIHVIESIEVAERPKWGFKALQKYIAKENSENRICEILDRTSDDIFVNALKCEEAVDAVASLMADMSFYHEMEISFFSERKVDRFFIWLLQRLTCELTIKQNKTFHAAAIRITYLFENSIDGEDALDMVNWMINTKIYDTIIDLHEELPAIIRDKCFSLIGKMISFSTMSMFCYMNTKPIIILLIEAIVNSSNPEDEDDNSYMSKALYRIAAFLAIQNDVEGFDEIFLQSNQAATQGAIERSSTGVIYNPEEETIVLDDSLRDEIIELNESDGGTHECISQFIERLDSILGIESS